VSREKTCFSSRVCCSDSFLELSHGAQSLYYQLCLNADNNGYIVSSKAIVRLSNCSGEDFEELVDSGFVLVAEAFGGGALIADWYVNNNDIRTRIRDERGVQTNERKPFDLVTRNIVAFRGTPYKSPYVLNRVFSEEEIEAEREMFGERSQNIH
jgi:hypothetical protein